MGFEIGSEPGKANGVLELGALCSIYESAEYRVCAILRYGTGCARSTALATKFCNKVIAALTAHSRGESDVEDGHAGFVIFMQRFGSAGNLNVQLHIITLDVTYEQKSMFQLDKGTIRYSFLGSIRANLN